MSHAANPGSPSHRSKGGPADPRPRSFVRVRERGRGPALLPPRLRRWRSRSTTRRSGRRLWFMG